MDIHFENKIIQVLVCNVRNVQCKLIEQYVIVGMYYLL